MGLLYTVVGSVNWCIFLNVNLTVIPLPIFCLKEIIRNVNKDLCTKMYITALIIRDQKGNKCPTLMKWLNSNYTTSIP